MKKGSTSYCPYYNVFKLFRTLAFQCFLILFCIACSKQNSQIQINESYKESYKIINLNGDLICRYNHDNTIVFDFKIGAGGAISELRWGSSTCDELLSPSFQQGVNTDRIVQSTWWLHSLKNNNTHHSEKRWNVTQGGNDIGGFSPVNAVNVDTANAIIEIYSYPQNQWDNSYDAVFHGGYKMLNRYEGFKNGVISIRRVMIGQIPDSMGSQKPYTNLYVEGWTPFNYSSSSFEALALGFDGSGNPNWWFSAGNNIPYYQGFPVEQTNGYAVVYKNGQLLGSTHEFATLVYGKNQVIPNTSYSYVLNTMGWNDGIGVLPGLNLNNFPVGGIIDQSFYLYISNCFNSNTIIFLNQLVSQLLTPGIYKPTDKLPPDLSVIVNNINQMTSTTGTKTEYLGALATGL